MKFRMICSLLVAASVAATALADQTSDALRALETVSKKNARLAPGSPLYVELKRNIPIYFKSGKLQAQQEQMVVAFLKQFGSATPPKTPPKPSVDGIQQQRVQLQSATHFVCEPSRSTAAVLAIKTPDTTKRIFEIRDKSREKSMGRVAVIANRFKEINKRTGWWNALTVGQAPNGEFVVKAPTKVGYLVTADRDFAEREGITPVALARILRDNIVKVFDAMPSLASMRSKENPTPEEKRASAQALRLDADAAFETDAKKAEELYKKSIEADNTYAEPVLGLAELFIEHKRIEDAKTLLKTSSEATSYPEEDRTKFKNRLKDLG